MNKIKTGSVITLGLAGILSYGCFLYKDFKYNTYERALLEQAAFGLQNRENRNPEAALILSENSLNLFAKCDKHPLNDLSEYQREIKSLEKMVKSSKSPEDYQPSLTALGKKLTNLTNQYQGNGYLGIFGFASCFTSLMFTLLKSKLS